jgi:acyl dehydratase
MRVFQNLNEVAACVGQEVAASEWVTVSQAMIDQFAQATGDLQWIHVDHARAAKGPFGTTIAHGFLTLSLLPKLFETAFTIEGTRMGINYGLNKVRFPSPVPSGSQVRGRFKLQSFEPLPENGAQMVWEVTVEREGGDKPVCVAESIVRRFI